MKLTHYIYIIPISLLAACSNSDEWIDTATAEHPNGAIQLSAGIVEGGAAAMTRAGVEDHHTTPGHLTLTENTALALRVSGTWTGHSPSEDVVYTTTATVGDETAVGSKHNAITCSPVLYWDDYGTADPDNNSTGRTTGLTIFGAAINGETSIPTSLNSISGVTTESAWTGFSWTLATDQSSGINDGDLLISNNVKPCTEDGTYKFTERESGKLLEFKHAMSKITVNLTAGAGFADNKFAAAPVVELTSNDASTSLTEWPCTTGTVNITTGGISSQGTHAVVKMATTAGGATTNVKKEALVVPGSEFASDNAIIAKINADGNIYYVKALNIRTAISASHASEGAYATQAGKNYILNITVNKTDIVVTATIANWTNVNAEVNQPVINVATDWGQTGTTLGQNFSFFISESADHDYGTSAGGGTYYDANSTYTYSSPNYTASPVLYWPNHSTAYYFRGIYPVIKGSTSNDAPQVTLSGGKQVVAVANDEYNSATFPSNFMLGMPRDPDGTDVGAKTATEGTIRMNFQYAMSHVRVIVQSIASGDNKVTFDTGSKVEILGGYTSGSINLSNGLSNMGTAGTYEMHYPTPIASNTFTCSDIILPQSLGNGTLKFKISAVSGGQTDTYETVLGISSIPVDMDGNPATDPVLITEWLPGHHYTYTLTITKTDIAVTATLTDWIEAPASTVVWF